MTIPTTDGVNQRDTLASLPSEELLARKWDKCLSNFAIKSGVGLTVGIGLSFLLFKRRGWPIGLATGFGAGMAYSQCSQSLAIPTTSSSVASTKQ
ncbi:hypothetical protein BASA50_001478 [Batrachochytrium salamandrivorans]|uniref:MICOS complex subunit MIC10 n=1 Tax=Batrachochytrium salamandrivorans TaxID=1357716 RepID=A0ABQ8FP39_9FUNG|nr:hypothetical protein BASA62_007844 [Batrachochytrium salamandrivorans]KAH6583526.1 hypothetical protein BASA60_001410 [Batrachochytrium salamandrivorans]KAH6596710.1 hypothetical protein BASA61_003404 [Batrachochytrium salamandrivorans]KAH6601620.1 hypothetical protein BASA50_001478 [Batrachochytrium salamandrivorans]KAH9250679.1 hypothetical protein BASA81_011531 [Batrachochytrium salamandrivorans]